MHKDRTCPQMNTGMIPMMPGMMPGMMQGMNQNMYQMPSFDTSSSNEIDDLRQQVNNLERRVSRLESQLNDTSFTNSSDSNTTYQMM